MVRPRLSEREVRLLGTGLTISAERPARRRSSRPPVLCPLSDVTRVLGLDLALNTTGWALLVAGQPAAHGSFMLPDRARNESLAHWLGRRADELARQVGVLLANHSPELVGYEYPDMPRPHWSGGSKGREFHSVQGLARAEGMLITAWPGFGTSARLVSVPASEARRTAAGRPNASKDQVRWGLMTYRRWDLTGWTEDQVDAAAVALAAREVI